MTASGGRGSDPWMHEHRSWRTQSTPSRATRRTSQWLSWPSGHPGLRSARRSRRHLVSLGCCQRSMNVRLTVTRTLQSLRARSWSRRTRCQWTNSPACAIVQVCAPTVIRPGARNLIEYSRTWISDLSSSRRGAHRTARPTRQAELSSSRSEFGMQLGWGCPKSSRARPVSRKAHPHMPRTGRTRKQVILRSGAFQRPKKGRITCVCVRKGRALSCRCEYGIPFRSWPVEDIPGLGSGWPAHKIEGPVRTPVPDCPLKDGTFGHDPNDHGVGINRQNFLARRPPTREPVQGTDGNENR